MATGSNKGFGNVGNTCGLNALLQCIAHTDSLREYFLQEALPGAQTLPTAKYSIVNELQRLLQEFWVNDTSIIPTRFAKAFEEATAGRIAMGEQMDMSEVFHVLLDKFEKEWEPSVQNPVYTSLPWPSMHTMHTMHTMPSMPSNRATSSDEGKPHSKKKDDSALFQTMALSASNAWGKFMGKVPVSWAHLMNGLQVGQVVCDSCHHIYHNFEPFTALSLEVPKPAAQGASVHLGECFKAYFDAEMLDGGWKCDKCNGCKAEKLARFWWTPKVLVIALKRFRYRSDGRLEKVHVPVDIPESFDFLPGTELATMTATANGGKKSPHRLRAIGCHFGSLNSGHYTALAMHNKQWHHYDDLRITPLEKADMALKNNIHAYMLFYERD